MLAPLLATEDPYSAASIFSQAGWKVEHQSLREQEHPRACLSLARSRIELVPPSDPYIVPRGLGIEFQIHVPPHELSGLFLLHRAAGVVFSELRERRPGERGFRAEIIGYRFLILGGDPDPDLAMVATDPQDHGARGWAAGAGWRGLLHRYRACVWSRVPARVSRACGER